jgi:hypothetical protein
VRDEVLYGYLSNSTTVDLINYIYNSRKNKSFSELSTAVNVLKCLKGLLLLFYIYIYISLGKCVCVCVCVCVCAPHASRIHNF